jgi:hypothetical protein
MQSNCLLNKSIKDEINKNSLKEFNLNNNQMP